jgi:hypothetical protein
LRGTLETSSNTSNSSSSCLASAGPETRCYSAETRSLASSQRERPPIGGAIPGFRDTVVSVGREPENPRLGGCAGSPKPTRLSLQFGEMQGDFARLQGQRRLIPAEGPRISMGWIGLSLIQEQGDHHSIAGKVDFETPRRCSSATFMQLNSMFRFRAPFGHRRMAR